MYQRLRCPSGFIRRAVLLLLIAVALASAWTAAKAAELDENGVVREALLRNHDLQAARAQVRAALGRLLQAGLWPNPRLELSNQTDAFFKNEGEYSRSAGLAQDFPISGRLALAENVARVDVARALAEVNEAERKLIGDVLSAFFAIAAIDQKLKLRDDLIASIAELATASRARFRAGEVSELDVNAAELELLRLKQDRTALIGERASALRTLAGLMGLDAKDALTLSTKPPVRKPLATDTVLVERAIERRGDLRLLSLSADRAQAEKALARASAWEDWTVSLAFVRDRTVIEGAPRQPSDDAVAMSVSIPFPLFNGNEGTRDAAEAEKIAAQEQRIALRQRIENEVIGAREQLIHLSEAVQTYETQALPLARKNSALARDAYRKGLVSIMEVVQAERQEKETGLSYAEALSQYFKGVVDLDTATVAHGDLMTHPTLSEEPIGGER